MYQIPLIHPLANDLYSGWKDNIANKNEKKAFTEKILPQYLDRKNKNMQKTKTFLHRHNPVNLYEVFQPLKLKHHREYIGTSSISEIFRNNTLAILGDAGSGKSTLIKHLFVNSIKTNFKIPVLLELRYFDSDNLDFINSITKEITNNKMQYGTEIIENMLFDGRFVIFFDGFDEISQVSSDVITKKISEFVENFPRNKFVLTSRYYAGADYLQSFYVYHLQKIEIDQIENFITSHVQNERLRFKILNSVKNQPRSYINDFLRNPLLLSIFILLFSATSDIPTKKYMFFEKVVNVLFDEHDARSKSGFDRILRSKLSRENIKRILELFCVFSYFDQKYTFDQKYLDKKMTTIRTILGGNLQFNTTDLLYDLKTNVSILAEDEGVLSFLHRSIQEYFAASYVASIEENEIKNNMYSDIKKFLVNKSTYEIQTFLSLCEEMDEIGFNKYLIQPSISSIRSSMHEDDEDLLYCKFLTALVSDLVINYKKGQAVDNFVSWNENILFIIQRFRSFKILDEKLIRFINAKAFTDFIENNVGFDNHIEFICTNVSVLQLIKHLHDDLLIEMNKYAMILKINSSISTVVGQHLKQTISGH